MAPSAYSRQPEGPAVANQGWGRREAQMERSKRASIPTTIRAARVGAIPAGPRNASRLGPLESRALGVL